MCTGTVRAAVQQGLLETRHGGEGLISIVATPDGAELDAATVSSSATFIPSKERSPEASAAMLYWTVSWLEAGWTPSS